MNSHRSEIVPALADADAEGSSVESGSNEVVPQDRTQSWSDNGKDTSLYDEAVTGLPETDPSVAKQAGAKQPAWPDDWRAQMADGDAKAARLLERYTSPDAVGKALLSAQQRIRSGDVKLRPGPDASEEQLAEWRQERGIPAAPEDYQVPILLDGKYEDLDEFGKTSIDAFRATFHELDMPPDHAEKIMSVANDVALRQMERQAETDAMRQEEAEDSLRTDWGADYRKNIALNAQFMQDRLGDDWQSFVTARTPEGLRLADDPKFNKFINQLARAEGGTVLQAGETSAGHNVQARIDQIRKIMSTDYSKYKREGLDVEYGKLLDARR